MADHRDAMAEYYAQRASEYERVYQKPERQSDLGKLKEVLSEAFAAEDVLEVACGTGYWTQIIAHSARSIVATDVNDEVLAIARHKDCGACRVTFLKADAYSPADGHHGCTAGFHGFWWSHIPKPRISVFLRGFHAALPRGAQVVMIDNVYVEGSSTPISRRDEQGNSYQTRRLRDGSTHEILKNFPSPAELRETLQSSADDVRMTSLQYYWMAQYRTRG